MSLRNAMVQTRLRHTIPSPQIIISVMALFSLIVLSCASMGLRQTHDVEIQQVYVLVPELEPMDSTLYDTPPEFSHYVSPIYPEDAEPLGIEGDVLVDLLVDEKGVVIDANVAEQPHGRFGDAAMEAVREWKFKPASKEGKPVDAWMTIPIHFVIDVTKAPVAIADEEPETIFPQATGEQTTSEDAEIAQDEIPSASTEEDDHAFVAYDTPPRIYHKVEPFFPELAKREEFDGHVVLNLLIDEWGNIADIEISKEDPKNRGFADAAVAAVMKWKFVPAYQGDKPVKAWFSQKISFELDN